MIAKYFVDCDYFEHLLYNNIINRRQLISVTLDLTIVTNAVCIKFCLLIANDNNDGILMTSEGNPFTNSDSYEWN